MSSMDYERGNQANGCLDRFFKLTKHGTSVKTEILRVLQCLLHQYTFWQ